MKIIAIIDYEKNAEQITKTIGRLSPQECFLDLYRKIQEQKKEIEADDILEVRLDMEF